MLCPLVMASVGMRNCSGGISTRLFTILNSKIVLIRALLSLSSSQPSCDIMLVTLLVCRQLFMTNLAPLRWTLSSALMFLWVGGSQIAAAYSIIGRTKVVNARSLADWGQVPVFLLKKAKVLFALLVMASMWVFQERFLEMLRPRYFVESTCWSMCSCMVQSWCSGLRF